MEILVSVIVLLVVMIGLTLLRRSLNAVKSKQAEIEKELETIKQNGTDTRSGT